MAHFNPEMLILRQRMATEIWNPYIVRRLKGLLLFLLWGLVVHVFSSLLGSWLDATSTNGEVYRTLKNIYAILKFSEFISAFWLCNWTI